MESLLKKVDKLLRRSFPGARTELELLVPEQRITGFVYWPGFEGREQIDRQRRVWDVLRSSLAEDERQQISAVFTLTPEEIAAIREE